MKYHSDKSIDRFIGEIPKMIHEHEKQKKIEAYEAELKKYKKEAEKKRKKQIRKDPKAYINDIRRYTITKSDPFKLWLLEDAYDIAIKYEQNGNLEKVSKSRKQAAMEVYENIERYACAMKMAKSLDMKEKADELEYKRLEKELRDQYDIKILNRESRHGAWKIVYESSDDCGRKVATKLCRVSDKEIISKMFQEIEILAKLSSYSKSINIARIYKSIKIPRDNPEYVGYTEQWYDNFLKEKKYNPDIVMNYIVQMLE